MEYILSTLLAFSVLFFIYSYSKLLSENSFLEHKLNRVSRENKGNEHRINYLTKELVHLRDLDQENQSLINTLKEVVSVQELVVRDLTTESKINDPVFDLPINFEPNKPE